MQIKKFEQVISYIMRSIVQYVNIRYGEAKKAKMIFAIYEKESALSSPTWCIEMRMDKK